MTASRYDSGGGNGTGGWRDDAACRSLDTNLFFPIGETGDAVHQTEAAKAICAVCPVQAECLEFAMSTNQQAGIFGGLNEHERRSLRRRRARQRRQAS
jgi:WhiB family redox-sensing transcriptional regulator